MQVMDAQPELALLAKALNQHGLEAILIGNMGAALCGAPRYTIDIDLLFRKTPTNIQKLKLVAGTLGAVVLPQANPLSGLLRVRRQVDAHQVNFIDDLNCENMYDRVRKGANSIQIADSSVLCANSDDLVRVQDARERSAALKKESELALRDLICARLALLPEKRLNVLRRKIGLRATCL